MAGDYQYNENDMKLKINCLGYIYGANIEDYPECMARVIDTILEVKKVVSITLAKEREYEYDYEQTKMVAEVAGVLDYIVKENLATKAGMIFRRYEWAYTDWNARLQYICFELLRRDPVGAYVEILREMRFIRVRMKSATSKDAYSALHKYLVDVLGVIKDRLEATKLITLAKAKVAGYHVGDRAIYRQIFSPMVRPNFMLTRYMIVPPEGGRSVDRYMVGDAQVEIYKMPSTAEYLYHILPPEFKLPDDKYAVLDQSRMYMATHQPKTVEFVRSKHIRDVFFNIGRDMIREVAEKNGVHMKSSELEQLANILTRYTAGLGVLEILMNDDRIQDIFVNSPIERQPILIFHSDFEECRTNLIPTHEDAEAWATRLRIESGRPLDEANPVLDAEINITGGRARFAVITRSLSPEGLGFAIRRHRDRPWTLPLFIKSGMLDSLAAGLLSFLVDGSVSLLVAGGRGAGKTSMLAALMLELLPKVRVVTIQDTLELPDNQMRDLGYNIESMKSRSVITRVETEMPADEALRAALRLGDSALIVGEVRSSIPGWEEVVVVENGVTKRVPIQQLENKEISDYSVPTLGFDMKVGNKPLAGFVKHPPRKKLLEVVTKTGRRVTVTPDHSLFHATKDFRVAPVECKDLKVGESIVIPASMPVGFNDVDEINVADALPGFRFENFEDDARTAIQKAGWERATEIAGVTSGDICNYFRSAPNQQINMPISMFRRLMDSTETDFNVTGKRITRGTGNSIPAAVPVNEDFCRFLGYFVGEGYSMLADGCGGGVILSNTSPALLNDMTMLSKNIFGLIPKSRITHGAGDCVQLSLGSVPLASFLDKLGCGRICTEKRAPPLIFGLSRPKIASFLRGLYSGDGSFTASKRSGNSIRYFSTSRKLVEDVSYLLQAFGIVGTIRERKVNKGNNLWSVEFKDRDMVETFMREIGFMQSKPPMIIRAWRHTTANSIKLDKDELRKHLPEYPRKYRHLFRFGCCSKSCLKQVANDPECAASERLKTFANGEFFLDEVKEIREIVLDKEVPVYDLSVDPSQNFIGGFGGILLHNTEARALYEAMRIGALSNVVAGTIHGESAYGVYDRVVNDLGVPPTSFKATDIIPICKTLRSADGMHRFRRMTEITEVRKDWETNPLKEGGFVNLMEYSGKLDRMKPTETLVNGESEVLNRISSYVKEWSGDWSAVWDNIQLRAKIKQTMVDMADKLKKPELLEAEWVTLSNSKYHLIVEQLRKETGAAEPSQVYEQWVTWVKAAGKGA